MHDFIAQNLTEPAVTGGAVGLGYAVVRVVETLLAKRNGGNGYAKASQVAALSDCAHEQHTRVCELLTKLLERQQAANGYAQEQAAILRRIAEVLTDRRDCAGHEQLHQVLSDLRVELARQRTA